MTAKMNILSFSGKRFWHIINIDVLSKHIGLSLGVVVVRRLHTSSKGGTDFAQNHHTQHIALFFQQAQVAVLSTSAGHRTKPVVGPST